MMRAWLRMQHAAAIEAIYLKQENVGIKHMDMTGLRLLLDGKH